MIRTVLCHQLVMVTIDENKFDKNFIKEFACYMYPFEDIDDHVKHLAQMYSRGFLEEENPFIEGYGLASDMGIEFELVDQYEYLED